MVRPQMEYMSAVWDPYYNSQIQQLEKVQHPAGMLRKKKLQCKLII